MKLLAPLLRKLGYAPIRRQSAPNRRSFAAAQSNRLTADWRGFGISLDSILSGDLDKLRARARDLAENNDYFQKFLSMLKNNVIGESGMTLKNKALFPDGSLDKIANKRIEDAWWEWGKKKNCTTTKDMTWLQVQHLAVEEWGTAGETLWELVTGAEADNDFGFALRPIAIDRLQTTLNHNLESGGKVRMGVQKNAGERVTHYWLADADPTDNLWAARGQFSARPRDASKFVHLFMRRRIGQSRGVPWAAAAMIRLKMLAGMDQAVLERKRAEACKMGFIVDTGAGVEYPGEDRPEGGKYMDAEPGSLEKLPMGLDVKFNDWNGPNDYDSYVKACVRGIGCGLNVSYPNLANDYESVNFSSGRMARMEETETWKMGQGGFACDFAEPVFAKWLEMSLFSQAVKLPVSQREKLTQPCFVGRRWGWVDPTKEVAAISEALRLKITSHTRVLSELGIDRDELFQEIAEDKKAAEQQGITLPDEAELAAAAQSLAEQQEEEAAAAKKKKDADE